MRQTTSKINERVILYTQYEKGDSVISHFDSIHEELFTGFYIKQIEVSESVYKDLLSEVNCSGPVAPITYAGAPVKISHDIDKNSVVFIVKIARES